MIFWKDEWDFFATMNNCCTIKKSWHFLVMICNLFLYLLLILSFLIKNEVFLRAYFLIQIFLSYFLLNFFDFNLWKLFILICIIICISFGGKSFQHITAFLNTKLLFRIKFIFFFKKILKVFISLLIDETIWIEKSLS